MKQTVLVTGAAGFLGRHVVDALRERGWEVRATDRAGDGVVRRDLAREPVGDLFDGVTHVVHAAGLFDLGAPAAELDAVNRGVTRVVAEAAADRGVRRFVHVSSVTVYGRPRRAPAAESTPHRPGNPYERSKAAGEREVWRLARERALPLVIVRPSGIYGPGSRYGLAVLIAAYALAAATGKREGLRAFRGGPRMTHVHVADVARAVAHLLEAEGVVGRAFNVADPDAIAWGDLLAVIAGELGLDLGAPIPLTSLRARAIALAWRWAPASRRDRVNRSLARRFDSLVRDRDLVPAIAPRLDRWAYDYWLSDHVYDTTALCRTGFVHHHPDARNGVRETIGWYRRMNWLPVTQEDE